MNLAVKTLIVTGAVVFTAGCSMNPFGKDGYFRDKSGDYVNEQEVAVMKIPGDLNPRDSVDLMPIPGITGGGAVPSDDRDVPLPQVTLRTETNNYTIQFKEGTSELITDRGADEVWNALVKFVEAQGMTLTSRDDQARVLETSWIQLENEKQGFLKRTFGSTPELETRLHAEVKSVQSGIGVAMNYARRPLGDKSSGSEWKASGKGPTQLLLNELVAYLADSETEDASSLQEQSVNVQGQTQLAHEGSGAPVLKIQVPFARSWSAIGEALEKAKIPITDRDRSAGLYYIKVNENIEAPEPEEEPGFWSSLFGGDKKQEQVQEDDGLQTLQVLLSRAGEESQVIIQLNADHLAPNDVAEKLLKLIERNLD